MKNNSKAIGCTFGLNRIQLGVKDFLRSIWRPLYHEIKNNYQDIERCKTEAQSLQ
jgi:hypothetical protein